MLIDSRFVFNTFLELPRKVFPFGKIKIKALPCVACMETFKKLDLTKIELLDIVDFIDEDKQELWIELKKKVDPFSRWTLECLTYTIISDQDLRNINPLKNLIQSIKLKKILQQYEPIELFIYLAKLNGLLMYIDSKFSPEKTVEYSGALDAFKGHFDSYTILKDLGLNYLTVDNYLNELSYLQLGVFSRLGAIKARTQSAMQGMGLSEDGLKRFEQDIENLKKLNVEKGIFYKKSSQIWHGYFSKKALENPFTPEREKYLKDRCGENSMMYKQYLRDKKKALKNESEFIGTI